MSTCWKCGQPTPDGVVECEDGCQPQAYRELMALAKPPEKILVMKFNIVPEPAVLADPKMNKLFNEALAKFMVGIGKAFVDANMCQFCKRVDVE